MARNGKGKMDLSMGMEMDWTSMILSVIMMALGLWFLAGGFTTQFNVTGQNFNWMVALWYVIGIALVWYGKMWAHKGCGCGCCGMNGE